MKRWAFALATALFGTGAGAVEQTIKNDSLTNGASGVIIYGFAANEAAASWLTSPCTGTVRAVQVFWTSPGVNQPVEIHDSVKVFRAGTFPTPGALAAEVAGPVLSDGVINEWRYLDENNTVPLSVPVALNEVFVVAFTFLQPPITNTTPSLVRDTDGIQSGRNALLAEIGGNLIWFDSATLGLTGDWVIRAVVDCPTTPQTADLVVGMSANPPAYLPGGSLVYTVTVSNSGPAAASATVVDLFPASFTGITWVCIGTGGANCPANGTGNLTHNVTLPAGGLATYTITGTVAPGTSGSLSNSATVVVGSPVTDPDTSNNTATLAIEANNDAIFEDDFDV
ncbi:MAG TPA: DUF11 domain-containing protein [Tahibacter sp.]|uniref:DUF11 domain-containing protein n=1 Tax=Tahibacter sp. TaxID=2056211 RepID=UPI002C7D0039|nr:DUF11 domain-containing protein [Tahibacter sp.]HSX62541.1 DUF11 domain-containing protein [Tahibacter sp.]